MDTLSAFSMGVANKNKELMVFDWDMAAKIIKDSGCKDASAGLCGDWEWTGGAILENGIIPDDSYTYLSSTWAKPQLEVNGVIHDCYKMASDVPGWDSGTFWPKSARKIAGLL